MRFLTSILSLVAFSSVFAQSTIDTGTTTQNVIKPERTETFKPGPSIDTRTMFPPIDAGQRATWVRPENPHVWMGTNDAPNDLVAGELTNESRGLAGRYFPAIDATGSFPPDPDLAVGPTSIVAVVNSDIAFFTKTGTKTFQRSSVQFFQGLGATNFQFDPKVFYDRRNQRFVMVFLELNQAAEDSRLLVAISDDSDPAGIWTRYRIDASLTRDSNKYWLDYPGFGYNKDFYVCSGNMFPLGDGGFGGIQFIMMPVSEMLAGQAVTVSYVPDAAGFTAQVTENWTDSPYVYGIQRQGNASMKLYAINTEQNNTMVTANVSVPIYSFPQGDVPSTNNRTLDALDLRLFQARQRGNQVVTAHTIQGNPNIAVRWYEFNLNNWPATGSTNPTLVQSGNIQSGSIHYHMGAVNVNSIGDISAVFSGSSSSVTADLLFAGRYATDPLGTMGPPTILNRSVGSNYSFNRWGDYFDTEVDPVDDLTFYGIGMTVRADNNWSTFVNSWNITPLGISGFTASPNPLPLGTEGQGRITLVGPQTTATNIALSIDPNYAEIPASITIPAGETVGTFPITPRQLSSAQSARITANAGSLGVRSTTLTITTIGMREPLEIWGGRSPGGRTITCIAYLSGPAPAGGASVNLSTTNETLAWPERSWVVVPAGESSIRFRVRTVAVNSPTTVFVRASRAGTTVQNDLTLLPADVSSLSISPSTIRGGNSVVGTVRLNTIAPNGGARVTLTSSNSPAVSVPLSVTVPAGQSTVSFTIRTAPVSSATTATVTASRLSSSQSTTLTVTP